MKTPSAMQLAVVAAGALASVPASATPVTLTHSVALDQLLQQGGNAALSFDIGSFLSDQGYSATDVVGGQVSVFGFSEASYGAAQAAPYGDYNVQTSAAGTHTGYYTYYVSGGYRCGWSYCSYSYPVTGTTTVQDYQRTSDRDLLHTDAVADQMRVTAGQASATATASTQSSSAGPFGAYLYDGMAGCTDSNCSWTYLYHRERNLYSAVYGSLDVALGLDAVALADLHADGLLGLDVAAPTGQFSLRSVSFDLLVKQPQAVLAAAVPEPAGLALTGVALAAALAAGRRRRRDA